MGELEKPVLNGAVGVLSRNGLDKEKTGEERPPDPEVAEKPTRRKFTAEYKLRILRQADACAAGELGALLRREGLYASHLTLWRRQREQGELEALAPKQRGRKQKQPDPLARRVQELERENQRLQKRLQQAEAIIEVQKKVAELLGIAPKQSDRDSPESWVAM